jgi:hypothetical protein
MEGPRQKWRGPLAFGSGLAFLAGALFLPLRVAVAFFSARLRLGAFFSGGGCRARSPVVTAWSYRFAESDRPGGSGF